ncbi:MAG: trypsin-like serine protease [Hyphomicrobiales bacterium]|nr:trypsin-like serine protease [Hyphomicrobiales bacterium]
MQRGVATTHLLMLGVLAVGMLIGWRDDARAQPRNQTRAPDLAESWQGDLVPDSFLDAPVLRPGDSKIAGGEPARRGAWPWQVAIYRRAMQNGRPAGKGYLFCGGSLIGARWVLTAAHCLLSEGNPQYDPANPGDLLVVEGTIALTPRTFGGGEGNGRKLRVSRVIMHEQWNSRTRENDIALLELAQPATSRAVVLATAPDRARAGAAATTASALESEGTPATVTGWGLLRSGQPGSPPSLMQVEIPLVSLDTCRQAYRGAGAAIDSRTICAGRPEGGKDSCSGDSGGPMVVRAADGSYRQVGIVSWGKGCGEPGYYGVYARVSNYIGWIRGRTGLALADPSPQGDQQTVTPPRPQVQTSPESLGTPGDRALLVGIDRYQNPAINLNGSLTDVRNMRRLLTETYGYKPEQIVTLLDEKATRAEILRAFDEWLIGESRPGARVFFYMSGHGSQVPDLNRDEPDGLDETIVPYDVKIEARNGRTVVLNQIIDDEIESRLKRISDRKITVVIDSCHSGSNTRGRDTYAGVPPGQMKCLCAVLEDYDPQALIPPEVRAQLGSTRSATPKQGFVERTDNVTAWSAVNDGQEALVDTEAPEAQGVFTRRFIDGIVQRRADTSGDGTVSHAEMLDFLRTGSQEYCRRNPRVCKSGLSPQLEARRELLPADVVTGRPPENANDQADNTLAHGNAAGVAVDFVEGTQLRVGQRAHYRVTTRTPGYLVLLDVAPDGKVAQVFPNEISLRGPTGSRRTSNLVPAGRPLLVPDPNNPYDGTEYVIDPPAGEGRLIAVLSKDPIRAVTLTPKTPSGNAGGGDLVTQIADELLREPVIAGKVQAREWSVAIKPYRIDP